MSQNPTIALGEPHPLLDHGTRIALWSEADFVWARMSTPDLEQRQ
jgi:hypothetical protein